MRHTVYLIGTGSGFGEGLTQEARDSILASSVIFGAKRLLGEPGGLAELIRGKRCYPFFQPSEIISTLAHEPDGIPASVLLSGDTGFYSGAELLAGALKETGCHVIFLPGISSVSLFASRLQIRWQDAALCSLHGRSMNVIDAIRRNRMTFILVGGDQDIRTLCGKLISYHLDSVVVRVGQRLGYPDEMIDSGSPVDILSRPHAPLSILAVENPDSDPGLPGMIPDDAFIRGKVPLTKCEVRTIAIEKLGLQKGSVLYDIGAGTGSVGIQAAVNHPDSAVYALERNPEAIRLIKENRQRFYADNLEILEGSAPDILAGLPAPTHAFIGGSGGSLREILHALWNINPAVRIVTTVIAVETLHEILGVLQEEKIGEPDIVQMSVARSVKRGRFHLMTGQNPVTILCF